MKKFVLASMLAMVSLLFSVSSHAQVSLNINIGNQPSWAPVGYDNATYYYLPDMDMYYDVAAHQFVYLNNNRWVRSRNLPAAYLHYDLYTVHKVALKEKNAYLHHDSDKKKYVVYAGKHDQQPIRDSRDEKYASNRNNWKSNHFVSNQNTKSQKEWNRNNERNKRG